MEAYTVVDSDARIRSGPPNFHWDRPKRIPRYTRVRIDREHGKYVRVEGLRGKDFGWTIRSNLGTYFKDKELLSDSPLEPDLSIAIHSNWPRTRRALAGTYNRLGGLMQTMAAEAGGEVPACLAVWQVESGGRKHRPAEAVIRFENHLLFQMWGDADPDTYDRHFRHGGHRGISGRRWQNHQFRVNRGAPWEPLHKSQRSEYRALELATQLAGEASALQCISIGGPQILVSNFRMLGYPSPARMFAAFQESERSHVLGFFDFCQFKRPGGTLLHSLKRRQWVDFAAEYNGPGKAEDYGTKIRSAYEAAQAVLDR